MSKHPNYEKVKAELVTKCFKYFSEKGYTNASLNKLVKELGISKGALYHYFPNKLSILKEMLNQAGHADVEEALKLVNENMSLEERIKLFHIFMNTKVSYFQNLILLIVDLYRNIGPNESQEMYTETTEYYCKSLTDNLKIPKEYADMMYIFLTGLAFHTKLNPNFKSYEEQSSLFLEVMNSFFKEEIKVAGNIKKNG